MAKSIDLKSFIEGIVYLKSEIDTFLAGKADASDLTDSINEVKGIITDEVDDLETAIAGKADATHNHNSDYAAINHNHNSDYAPITHNHTKSQITDFAHTHGTADVLVTENKNLTTKLGELDSAISSLQAADWDIEIVTTLPAEGAAGKLYFLHDANEAASGNGNAFDEYIWDATNERFEKLGQRKINLTNYVTDVNIELSQAGVLTVSLTKDANAQTL